MVDTFQRGITQSLIKQYTNSVNTLTTAIELNPSNPFLYLNRSTTRAEMIDFISSIDNSYQRISIDSDPANRLNTNSKRTYSYDEAIADLNKARNSSPSLRIFITIGPICKRCPVICPRLSRTTRRPSNSIRHLRRPIIIAVSCRFS